MDAIRTFFAAIPILAITGVFAAPTAPQGGRAAIIDLANGSNHALLVGGWDGKRWVADKSFHPSVRGGERYRFYGRSAKAGEASGGKATLARLRVRPSPPVSRAQPFSYGATKLT